ncbi:MAG: ABC transporter ATP-binding protein [Planctomycetota bacterium]|nr:ABC transporter ATP-binding protein [Planctomycetota bacterium]
MAQNNGTHTKKRTMSVAILCQDLLKTYPGKPPVEAVRGIDLEIMQGECFGLLGPNGAGKTTTVEILEGILTQTSGKVEILGKEWSSGGMAIRESIGISLQETRFSEKLSILEILRLFGSFYQSGISPEDAIARVGLQEKKNAWVKSLSGGQKQRLAVATAIIGNPEILFLDEPTTGLDPTSRRQLWNIIESFKQENRTVLLTTHYMEEAETLCDRVAIVDQGKIIRQGTPRDLIAELGGSSLIEFSIAEGENRQLIPMLSSMSAVSQVTFEKNHYLLAGNEADSLLPALNSTLEKLNCRLTGLSTRNLGLEDVFLSLTGRSLDDQAPDDSPDRLPGLNAGDAMKSP